MPDALPAVTVPVLSCMKHGLSFDNVSIVVPCRGNWSAVTTVVPDEWK